MTNAAPIPSLQGPTAAVRGQTQTLTLNADDWPDDQTAGFTFTIDWGDGSDPQIVTGLSGTQVAHIFYAVGTKTVSVTATDKDGGTSDPATQNVTVTAVQLLPNSQNPALTDLVWAGAAGQDQVKFEQIDATTIRVTTLIDNGTATNIVEVFTGVTGRVIANGAAGNDTLDASGLTITQATLDGGAGNNTLDGGNAGDTLIGGSNGGEGKQGSNTIVAGNGNNTIYGNAATGAEGSTGGNNLIVGGADNDTIYGTYGSVQKKTGQSSVGGEGSQNLIVGGGGSDVIYASRQGDGAEGGHGSILIAGSTSLDPSALTTVMSEWTSTDSYSAKIANISGTGSGPYLQASATAFDDGVVDQLYSDTKGQLNWLLYSFSQDLASRIKSGETQTDTA